MKKCFYIFLILCFGSFNLESRQAFHQVITSYAESRAVSAPHPGGGLVVTTSTEAFTGNNFKKLHILRIGTHDSILWSQYLHVGGNIYPVDLKVTVTGDIVVLAHVMLSSNNKYEIAVICLDVLGNEKWQKKISGGFGDYAYNLHITSQNEIAIFGNTYLEHNANCRSFILKMNMAGNIISSKAYLQTYVWGVSTVTSDDHFVIRNGGHIWKVKPNGNVAWSEEILFSTGYTYKIKEDTDSNFIFLTQRAESWFLVKIRSNDGAVIWISDAVKLENLLINPRFFLYDVTHANDGGYLAVGKIPVGDKAPATKTVAIKFGINGKFLSAATFDDTTDIEESAFYNVHHTSATSIEFTGNTGSEGSKIFRVKTSSDLKSNCTKVPELITASGVFGVYNGSPVTVNDRTFSIEDLQGQLIAYPVHEEKTCETCDTPKFSIAGDTVFCPADTIELKATGDTGKYRWSTGDSTSSIRVSKGGTYSVTVTNVCGEAADTITIKEGTTVQPDFTITPTSTTPLDAVFFADKSKNAEQRLWHTGDGHATSTASFSHIYNQNGKYPAKLELISPDGCTWDTTIFINNSYHSWFIPNAFTPNNDDLNEVFGVKGHGIREYRLQVYNRWGERIFEGVNQGWNGRYKGRRVRPGIYIYRLFLQYDDGQVVNHSGEVHLVE